MEENKGKKDLPKLLAPWITIFFNISYLLLDKIQAPTQYVQL